MNRNEALSNLQQAINMLVVATASVSKVEDLPEDTDKELKVLFNQGDKEYEVIVFFDKEVLCSSSGSIDNSEVFPRYGQIFAQLQGRPKNLPPRTCPRCKGQGKI